VSGFVRGSNLGNEYKRDEQSFFKGIVVKNSDPEQLLRVKVYIPEVSNQPLENWLKAYEDSSINIRFPGTNIPGSSWSDTKIFEDISKFLPWAEPVLPILGESGPMRYNGPSELGINSETNYKEGWQTNDETPPTIEEGSFAPAYAYENLETNIGDAYTNPTDNFTVNNNPYGQDFQPINYTNAPAGNYSIPRVGAHVWVFHYRGNLNFPVYFGGRVSYRDTGPIFADGPAPEGGGPAPSQDYPDEFENKPAVS
tara:strand:+ start:447 stop:1208 length:762 start_codon:yes stop_codon:yes gene_type:complete